MKNLYRFSLFAAFAGLVLIIAGGLVTSHQAGLSVPDWPLSYGKWMPPMVGKIFWEHGHRMIASSVGFLVLVMVFWTHLSKETSSCLKSFSRILLELVILQGVFGGLTVIYNLPHAVSILHASLGQIFFTCLWLFAYAVKTETFPQTIIVPADKKQALEKAFRIARITAAIIFLQLLLGAATRHVRHLHIAWTHAAFALVVIMHIVFCFLRVSGLSLENKTPYKITMFLLIAVMFQLILGGGSLGLSDFLSKSHQPTEIQIWFTTFHQSLGAVILASTSLLAAMLKKHLDSFSPVA